MISLARYSALLAQPAVRTLILASVLGRLPIGITGLAVLLLGQQATASFGRGGMLAACYVAGLSAFAPLLGRWIDRRGPRWPLLGCALSFPCALAALVTSLSSAQPLSLALILAFVAGACFPPITVCMRTFFRQRLKEDSLLAAAYSLESVLMEMIFIVGPVLVSAFVALATPSAAVLFAAVCGCAGTLLFRRSLALTGWRIEARVNASLFGPLTESGFPALLCVVLCYASAFGLVEIATTAYAAEAGVPSLAGVMLGIMSIGSAAGGLVYGSRNWRMPLARQFPVMLIVMGAGVAPLALLPGLWSFGLWCLVAGIAMAPALIMQSMLVAKIARAEHATEAFTWSATSLLAGVGLGLTGGGALLEIARSPAVFGAAAGLSVAAGVLALRLVRTKS